MSDTFPALTLQQRFTVLDALERESARLEAEAKRLDEEHEARYASLDVVDDEHATEYDASAAKVDAAYDASYAIDDLRALFGEDRRIILTQPLPTGDPVDDVAQALVRAWQAGADVGEVVAEAAKQAQLLVFRTTEEHLTSNRPGSWEASYLDQIIESSGWEHDLPKP